MNYLRIKNGNIEYKFNVPVLRQENPGVSFPSEMPDSLLSEYGVFPVIEAAPPNVSMYEDLEEGLPILVDGVWVQTWVVVPVSPPISITRRQCALELYHRTIISLEEALAMTKIADVPAAISQVLDAAVANGDMTTDERMLAEIDLAATNYYRNNSLLSKMGMTDQQIDQFFISASKL